MKKVAIQILEGLRKSALGFILSALLLQTWMTYRYSVLFYLFLGVLFLSINNSFMANVNKKSLKIWLAKRNNYILFWFPTLDPEIQLNIESKIVPLFKKSTIKFYLNGEDLVTSDSITTQNLEELVLTNSNFVIDHPGIFKVIDGEIITLQLMPELMNIEHIFDLGNIENVIKEVCA